MSSKNDSDKYFEADLKTLRVGSTLTFDVYLYLTLNDRFVQWIRTASEFTAEHLAKCEKSKTQSVYIPKNQKKKYDLYYESWQKEIASMENGAVAVDDGSEKNTFGFVHVKGDASVDPGIVHVKSENKITSAPPRMKVDKDFLNCIIGATRQTFLKICNAEIQSRPPFRRGDKKNVPLNVEVASVVSLVSQTIRGSVGLCFPAKTYLYTLSKASGRSFTQLTPEICAGSGELMQFLFDRARPELMEIGYHLERAVPTLVYGKALSLPHLISDPGFSIIFDSPGGPFQFEIGVKTGG